MNEVFIRRLFEIITRWAAIRVAGTEAYPAAIIDRARIIPELRQLAHIRPGDASEEKMADARKAFEQLIAPCLTEDKDGAIEVSNDPVKGKQYCLIHVLRDEAKQATA